MTQRELADEIQQSLGRIKNLVSSGQSSVKERDSLKNLLYNHAQEILDVLNGNTGNGIPKEVEDELQYLREEAEAYGDALAADDQQIKIYKYIMKQQGLDPAALMLEYEYESGLRERPETVEAEVAEVVKNTKKKRTKATADSGGDEAGGGE